MALHVEGILNDLEINIRTWSSLFFKISGPNQFLQEEIMTLGFSYSCKSLSKYSPQIARKLAINLR